MSSLRIPEVLSAYEHRYRQKEKSKPIPGLVDTAWLPFLLPALGFVVLYSFLGHKEARFMFPVLPLFNLAAAVGASRIHHTAFPPEAKDKKVSMISRVAFACSVLSLVGTLAGTGIYIVVSSKNYPGGEALRRLVDRVDEQTSSLSTEQNEPIEAKVYIDVAAAMSGVSLFGQRAAQQRTLGRVIWSFEKEGYEAENAVDSADWSRFTHLVTENWDLAAEEGFVEVANTAISRGVAVSLPQKKQGTTSAITDSMYVLERAGWLESSGKRNRSNNEPVTA